MEDDPGLARLFQKKLERSGYIVDIARDGKEGLAMYEKASYDIVAVDQQMPAYSGLEVLKILSSRGTPPPVIMVTGTGSEEIAVEAMKLGASDYIIKDVEGGYLELLPSLIEKILRKQQLTEERKKAEIALRESEEKYRNVVERANDGVVIVQDTIIKYINPRKAEVIGFTVDEMINTPFIDYVHPDEVSRVSDFYRRRLAGEDVPPIYETVLRHKNGRKIEVELNVGFIPYETKNSLLVIVRDITERKRLEEELLNVQRLESIGILAGGIAHDFNNILTSILGNAYLAKRHCKPEDKIHHRLEELEKAALRAKDLSNQFITFSKGGEPIKEKRSIAQLLKDATHFTLSGSNVECDISLPEDLGQVEIDSGQIRQVFNNLVVNAKDSMLSGGLLEVTAENAVIGDKTVLPLKPGNYIKISFKDHGTGIPEEDLPRIFDPYFTTKKQKRGLGLTTVFSIMKHHDGYISVTSKEGEETTASVYFPSTGKEKTTGEEQEPETYKGKGKILLMDDEEMIRTVVGEMLEYLGYETILAKDGAEAIAKYNLEVKETGWPFDAVIMDLTVPGGMGGKECIEKLLEIDPDVKALVSSGYSNDPIMANFQEYGFRGVVTKPYKIEELGKALYLIMNGENG